MCSGIVVGVGRLFVMFVFRVCCWVMSLSLVLVRRMWVFVVCFFEVLFLCFVLCVFCVVVVVSLVCRRRRLLMVLLLLVLVFWRFWRRIWF